jgi:quercetin dioxygenase-like cupin family protein
MQLPYAFGSAQPVIRHTRDAPVLEAVGARIRVLVTGADTGEAWSLLEFTVPAEFAGPLPHYHVRTTELIYVLEGSLSLELGEQAGTLEPGGMALVPPRTVHRFWTPAGDGARFLVQFAPAGMEAYFRELAEMLGDATRWPLEDMRPVMALGERHDTFSPRIG